MEPKVSGTLANHLALLIPDIHSPVFSVLVDYFNIDDDDDDIEV